MVEIKNEYNPLNCYGFKWQIPNDVISDVIPDISAELTQSDRDELSTLIANDQTLIDDYLNNPKEETWIRLTDFMANSWEDDITIISGYPFDSMLPNKDSFINFILDQTEFIQSQKQSPSDPTFQGYQNINNDEISIVTATQTITIQTQWRNPAITDDIPSNVISNFEIEFTAEFIRRNTESDARWKIRRKVSSIKESGITQNDDMVAGVQTDFAANAKATSYSNSNSLNCNIMNDTYREDIIAGMIARGYEVEFGESTYGNVDDSSGGDISTFRVPFVNADSDYATSFFDNNGLPANRMGGQDIILFRGCTPPLVTYYSYRSYLSATINGLTEEGFFDLDLLEASMGDSTNNLVIKTEDPNGNVYDVVANIATTGDEQSFNDLKGAFEDAGLSPDSLNLDSIPIEGNFAFSQDLTVFPRSTITTLFRLVNNGAVRDEREALVSLYQNETQPLYIFRKLGVTEPRIPISANLRNELVPNILSENTLLNRILFESVVRQTKIEFILRRRMILVSDTQFIQDQGFITDSNGDDLGVFITEGGFYCVDNDVDCIFDNRDTTYTWDKTAYTLGDDDIYILVGLNHNSYRMTLYNSVGIYYVRDPIEQNFIFRPLDEPNGSVIDDEYEEFNIEDVIGSSFATTFTDSFIASVSRPSNCLNNEMASLCPDNDQLSDTELFVYLARAHLNTRTQTAPNEDQLIPWRLLRFRKTIFSP